MNHILAQCSGTPVAEHIVFDMNRFCYFFPFFAPARAQKILQIFAIYFECLCGCRRLHVLETVLEAGGARLEEVDPRFGPIPCLETCSEV